MPCPAGVKIQDASLADVGTTASPARRGEPVTLRPADDGDLGDLTADRSNQIAGTIDSRRWVG